MLIKKIIFILIAGLFSIFFTINAHCADISARSAVVINSDSKEIIYEKNAFEKLSMASTTKILTSILAVESGKMNDKVTIPSSALTEGSSIGLKQGYVLTLTDLVYGMMLESGNDAANACALYLGGSFENFASKMNEKAAKIGMSNSNFVTASGLDDENHYTTAYDMALLGAYSIRNPIFREICSDKTKKIAFEKPEMTVTFSNHNRLLDTCEGVFGIKTGFTKKSGRCLVSACERDGATLICVTLNAGDDWNDHQKLYDLSFSELNRSTVKYSLTPDVQVYGGNTEKAEIYCDEYVYHYKESEELTKQIIMPKIVYAPIEKNEIIGQINYFSGENLVYTAYIYSKNEIILTEETHKNNTDIFNRIKSFFRERKDKNDRR